MCPVLCTLKKHLIIQQSSLTKMCLVMARAICTIEQGFHWGVIRFETSNATEAVAVKLLWKAVVVHSAYPDYFSFLFPPSKSAWGLTSHQEGGGLELSKRAICWHFAIFLELSDFSTTPFHLHTLYKNMPCCHLQQNFTKKYCG